MNDFTPPDPASLIDDAYTHITRAQEARLAAMEACLLALEELGNLRNAQLLTQEAGLLRQEAGLLAMEKRLLAMEAEARAQDALLLAQEARLLAMETRLLAMEANTPSQPPD